MSILTTKILLIISIIVQLFFIYYMNYFVDRQQNSLSAFNKGVIQHRKKVPISIFITLFGNTFFVLLTIICMYKTNTILGLVLYTLGLIGMGIYFMLYISGIYLLYNFKKRDGFKIIYDKLSLRKRIAPDEILVIEEEDEAFITKTINEILQDIVGGDK